MTTERLAIGIDTGGTFTDAVVVDRETGAVRSKAKALTTRHDLGIGIAAALAGLDRSPLVRVELVALSTTLATNGVVEGKGAPVGLLVAVPDPATFTLPAEPPAERFAVIAGAHDRRGRVAVPLDEARARAAIEELAPLVGAFAISGYFSIYNAEHERRLRELVAERCAHPVVCGHELTGDVGLAERAATACLNARLLPVIGELLAALRPILARMGVDAPLMVVRGDGSLISEGSARARPVETVLSGPAASVHGACRLSGLADALVVDIGGTTSDIAVVRGGAARACPDGANVGGWQTRVKALDLWTVGLGGDSRIAAGDGGGLAIGPRRAIPLCSAAHAMPAFRETLRDLAARDAGAVAATDLAFYTFVRRPPVSVGPYEERLLAALDGRVRSARQIADEVSPYVRVDRLVDMGAVAEVAFTPTDVLHVQGRLALWDAEAARLGCRLLARATGLGEKTLLDRIDEELQLALCRSLAAKALIQDPAVAALWSSGAERLLAELLARPEQPCAASRFSLSLPVVAVGAPAEAFLPPAAARLGTRCVVPPHAEVANAVGAVCASVVERAQAFIRPDVPFGFAVVMASRQGHADDLEGALRLAEGWCREAAAALAVERGADTVEVAVEHAEKRAPVPGGQSVTWECLVTATATGSPVSRSEPGRRCA
jgi:N-methylhydantoinase A/oxoprolinase/acetone carboxylase beta subunit